MAFDVRAGGRVAAVDLPRRYGALGRAGSFFKTNRSASGPPLLASGSVSEPACALHADANKVVLGSPEGFAHVVDPRTGLGVTTRRVTCVRGRRGVDTDPLATAGLVMTSAAWQAALAKVPGASGEAGEKRP